MPCAYATPLKRIHTLKGDILHALKRSDHSFVSFGEAYLSYVKYREIKGWKRHTRMTLNLIVVAGEIEFLACEQLVVNEPYSIHKFKASPDDLTKHIRLTVPPMVWLAFKGIRETDNLLLNLASEEHDPSEAETASLEMFPIEQRDTACSRL